jgi:asparagine synthetase B (glutamine-hydrolysing)
MCGIVCAFDLKQKAEVLRPQVLEMSKIIRHRDHWSGIYSDEKQSCLSVWQLLILLQGSKLLLVKMEN